MNHTNSKNLPKVAIIGRPNVGKSSLFNRILKRRKAIIESVAGVTRDRLYAQIKIESKSLILVDTGGIVSRPKEKIAQAVYRQSQEAINEADLILFICDATSGMTDQDDYIASLLKASKKKTFLLINKVDSSSKREFIFDFYKLGLGEPYEISVLHGRGFSQLYKDLAASLPATNNKEALKQEEITKIAIVGRPNVGKSSFINCILDEERLVVDEMPGTTRDSIDIFIKRGKGAVSVL